MQRMMRNLAVCIISGWLAGAPVWAITEYGSTPVPGTGTSFSSAPTLQEPAGYTTVTTDGGWSYEGDWIASPPSNTGAFLGTPIAPQWFATVSHVGGAVGNSFLYHGTYYQVIAKSPVIAPDTNGQGIQLWEVAGTFPTFAPMWNTNVDGLENGLDAVIIGRGTDKGDPVSADDPPNYTQQAGWQWGAYSGTQRWGQNVVSRISGSGQASVYLQISFNAPGTGDNTSNGGNEGMITDHDSGGGMFIYSPASNEWKLAGLNEGLTSGPYSLTAGGPTFFGALYDTRGLYANGSSTPITGAQPVGATAVDDEIGSVPALRAMSAAMLGSATVWTSSASGNWSSSPNWWSTNWFNDPSNMSPNAAGQAVILGSAITAPTTITLNSPATIGALTFDNANAYTVAGASMLTFSPSSGSSSLAVNSGSHTISAPVRFNASTTITVAPNSSLTISGPSSSASGVTLTSNGPGLFQTKTLRADNVSISAGTTQILPNGTASALSTVKTLSISNGATLDLTNNDMVIDWSSTDPTTAIGALLKNSYDGGKWDLPGLNSSAAAGNPLVTLGYADNSILKAGTFDGQSVDQTSTLVKYTYVGDANLDGVVNAADLALMSSGGTTWMQGDFNYDGVVNADDYAMFALSLAAQGAPITPAPEPTGAAIILTAMGLGLFHRRRHL